MSNYVQLDVWFQEDKLSALSSVLVEQGTTVEKRMQGVLLDMYEALVPRERGDGTANTAHDVIETFCVYANLTTRFFVGFAE